MPNVEKVARDLAKSSGSSASWRRTMKDQLSMVREMERIETRQQKMLDKTMNLHMVILLVLILLVDIIVAVVVILMIVFLQEIDKNLVKIVKLILLELN